MDEQIYNTLKNDKVVDKKLYIFGIAVLAGIAVWILGFSIGAMSFSMMGFMVYAIALFPAFFFLGQNVGGGKSLRVSLKTAEATGSIKYINELTNKNYVEVKKAFTSEHFFYIPGRLVIAYEDFAGITSTGKISEYSIKTRDGVYHRICLKKEDIACLLAKAEKFAEKE